MNFEIEKPLPYGTLQLDSIGDKYYVAVTDKYNTWDLCFIFNDIESALIVFFDFCLGRFPSRTIEKYSNQTTDYKNVDERNTFVNKRISEVSND